MNRDDAFYRHFDHVHSIAVKAARQVPDDRLDFRPTPEMYTARELVFHMFSQERAMLAGHVLAPVVLALPGLQTVGGAIIATAVENA